VILFISGVALLAISLVVGLGFIRKNNRSIRSTSLVLMMLANILLIIFALQIFIPDSTFRAVVFQFAPQIGISIMIDRLGAFFVFLISIVSLSVAIYSIHYVEESSSGIRRNLFIPLINLFIFSMLFFVASDNSFSQLFFWELMSLTSFFLVMFHYENDETKKAGTFYFIMTQMSTVFLLAAFILIYNFTGSFDLQKITGISPALNSAIFVLLFIGFGIKAGIIPFHKWLPYAHSSSPSNVSALMSGVMIKVAIYGLLRYVLFVLSPDLWWGIMILLFGTLSALMGVVYALKEHDIKRLLAYHSIENIGIILIGFGLYIIFNAYGLTALAFVALAGSLFHTLNHAIFKSLLFLTAGSVVEETGTRNIEKMGGLVKNMPFTAGLFLIGAVAISALPPLNGFVSELLIFQAFFQSFNIINPFIIVLLFVCLALFALTSALAAACFVKAFGIVFLAMPRSDKAKNAHEVSRYMLVGPGILATLCILLGVFSYQLFQYLGFQPPIPNLMVISIILLVFLGLSALLLYRFANRKSRLADTWSCGLPAPGYQTEYTASGFSEPILTFFRPIYRTKKSIERHFWDKPETIFKSGTAEIHVMKVFEEKIYMPLAKGVQAVSRRVSGAQNVDLDTFILYSFVTIIILIIALGWLK
jgi:hydrogenase-4 component B